MKHLNRTQSLNLFVWMLLPLSILVGCNSDEPKIERPAGPHFSIQDSLALVDIYQKAKGEVWYTKWDLKDIQTWGGVSAVLTDSNVYRVTQLLLPEGAEGILSDKIGELTELRVLGMGGRGLVGSIPAAIGSLTHLEELHIVGTSFQGSIPKEIGNLKNLRYLRIIENDLTELPEEIGQLPVDSYIDLSSNKFQGTVPEGLFFSQSGQNIGISLENNNFTDIAWSYFLNNDEYMVPILRGNRLSGTIPDDVMRSSKWEKYKDCLTKQQEGYGYSNL